jgi:hypothetical protein
MVVPAEMEIQVAKVAAVTVPVVAAELALSDQV